MMQLPAPVDREPDWRPGDPLYPTDRITVPAIGTLTDCCPPSCWHNHPQAHGGGMRWSPDYPTLRFLPDGLHTVEPPGFVMEGAA